VEERTVGDEEKLEKFVDELEKLEKLGFRFKEGNGNAEGDRAELELRRKAVGDDDDIGDGRSSDNEEKVCVGCCAGGCGGCGCFCC